MDQLQRDIGKLEAKTEGLEERLSRMEGKLDAVAETLSEAKGGWKTLLMMAGASGAVGALIGKFLPFLK